MMWTLRLLDVRNSGAGGGGEKDIGDFVKFKNKSHNQFVNNSSIVEGFNIELLPLHEFPNTSCYSDRVKSQLEMQYSESMQFAITLSHTRHQRTLSLLKIV